MSDLISREEAVEFVKVRHGKWEKAYKEQNFVRCSECGQPMRIKFNYCPRCGARMVEDER